MLVLLGPGAVAGDPVAEVTESLSFSTRNQSLWGPRSGERTKSFGADLFKQSIQGSEGRIIEDVPVGIDNSAAVRVWETALQRCMDTCFGPAGLQVCPSQSQCINGAIITYPCPTFTNPFRTCTVDIGGIGPKPSGTIDRPFDIGAEVAWDALFRWGVEGGITVDEGSIDVDVRATVRLEAEPDPAAGDEVFVLRAVKVSEEVELRSEWPSVSAHLDTYLEARARIHAEVAGPNTETGGQIRETAVLFSAGDERVFRLRLAGFRAGADGLELQVLDKPPIAVDAGIEFNIAFPIEVPGVPVGVGIPILDVGLFSPELALPPAADFDGQKLTTPYDGVRLVDGVTPGRRDLFNWGILKDGVKDTDVGRFDVDLDAPTAALWGVPLGIKVSAGTIIPGVLSLLTAEGNALDLDSALFFGFREKLAFEPHLVVDVAFDRPVPIETEPGSGDFQPLLRHRMPAGGSLRIRHSGGALKVKPVYSLAENVLVNDTDLIGSPVVQGTLFQLKLGGLLFTVAGAAGLPTNLAAAQLSLDILSQPIKLADLNYLDASPEARFALGGFTDVPGAELRIQGARLFRRGDPNGDGAADISDASATLDWLFVTGQAPACPAAANTNGDAGVDISDALHLLGFLFLGGPPPVDPYPACGRGPLPGDEVLGCEAPPLACR